MFIVRFILKIIPLLLFFLLALALGLKNQHLVTVNLLVVETELKQSILLAGALGIGFSFGLLVFIGSYLTMRIRYRRLHKKLLQQTKVGA